ncbi:glycerol-3-phosphate 1-O-acyltransferase PlsB [Metallibacterium scheffleri]
MNASPIRERRPPWALSLLGALLRPWLKIKRDPAEPAQLLDPEQPVLYVIERRGISDTLILDQACQEAGLPSPLRAGRRLPARRRRALLALDPQHGLFGPRRRHAARDGLLAQLRALQSQPGRDVQLVPVSIYVGRAPNRESGWFRVLFSENWAVVGRFRRLLALLLNGRDSIVHFSPPVSLRKLLIEADGETPPRLALKLSRVLRAHFRRVRAAVIGPDLSHRRTLVDALLASEPVRTAITQNALKEKTSRASAQRRARGYAMEIAADYSHPVVRSASFALSGFWNKLFDGISMHHFESLRAIAPGHEVIYVPSHRSHADYLLLSYQLYKNGLVPPHIAAGVNLNLPIVGPLLRRGGAFFLRRSFKANALYSSVFAAYVDQLLQRGVSMEYFVEGGRSRTGRLLPPRAGMLAITLRAFLRTPRRPVVFQPVYIGYEKLMEGDSYLDELSGRPKQKESLLGVLRGFGVLRRRYGRVTLNFGEPIFLERILEQHAPDWRSTRGNEDERPGWFPKAVDSLAERINIEVNRAAHVNPINLLAVCLLATPKHALAEQDLRNQLALYKTLLTELPYSARVTITPAAPEEIVAYGERMGWIRRIKHPLGDVLVTEGDQAVLLSYFRNNVLHLFAPAAWVAACFLNNRRMARASVLRMGRMVYPFIRSELFLPWDDNSFGERLGATIELFVRHGLLQTVGDARLLERGAGQDDEAYQLRVLAHSLLQTFERYYIAIATLVKAGPGAFTAAELEQTCVLTAQRLSLLQQLTAPEFFDKALFRGFIQQLREQGAVRSNSANKLEFDAELAAVVRDARLILSRGVRETVLKIVPGSEPAASTASGD